MLVTIRHGETNYNKKGIFSGSSDKAYLTKEALIETYNKGKELKKYNFDIAIVSPLSRAKQTFNELNKTLNIPYVIENCLTERDFKEYEGKPYDTLVGNIWMASATYDHKIETIPELANRVEPLLDKLRKEYKDKNILIVSHAGVSRIIKYLIEGKKEENLKNFKMENLHVDVFKEW